MASHAITSAEVELVLRRALQRDAHVLDFQIQAVGGKVGFMGDHNTMTVQYSDENGPSELTFFVKKLPEGERFREFVLKNGLFTKEKEMYEKLLPLMQKNLKRRMPVADCYFIRDDGYVILEDLNRMGYKLWDKYAFLGRRQVEAALRAVAELHAGSLAVEIRTGKLMPRHADHCYEALIADNSSDNIVSRQWHFSSLKTCFSLLQKMQCYKSRLAAADWDAVYEKMQLAWEQAALATNGFSAKYRNVLSHGDLWVNNVLFSEQFGTVQAVLVDFQIYRYAPPVLDLLMLLHFTTSREFRARYQHELIQFYFEQLENLLLGAEIGKDENPIKLEQLQESAVEFEYVAAILAARYIPTCLKQGLIDRSQISTAYSDPTQSEKYATKEFAIDQSDILVAAFGCGELGKRLEQRTTDTFDSIIDVLKLADFVKNL